MRWKPKTRVGTLLSLFVVTLLFASAAFLSTVSVTRANNLQVENIAPNAAPDLVIESITITPANPGAGDTADIAVVIKNVGDDTAGGFMVHLYVDPVDNPPTATTQEVARTRSIGLLPGDTFSFTRTGHDFTKDNPVIIAWADRDNEVAESNEDNNLQTEGDDGSDDAPPPDSYEDDNDCANANPITSGVEQMRNLTPPEGKPKPDVDWTKFDVISGETYVAAAIADGEDADLSIEVHTKCSTDPSLGAGATVTFTALSSETYYLKVTHNQDEYGPETAYRLKLTGGSSSCVEHLEPNSQCSLPADLVVSEGAQKHNFCSANDVDWMKFEVKAGAKYKVKSTNIGPKADAQLLLFTSCTDSGTGGQELEFTAASAGFVYLSVENLDKSVFGPETEYEVDVEVVGGTEGCTEDGQEQDDNIADAKAITLDGGIKTYNTCPSADADFVKVDIPENTEFTIETLNLASNSDTKLCQYDANGTKLTCDDDGGAGKGDRMTIQSTSAATYYFKIEQNDEEVAGEETQYGLQVIKGKCIPDTNEPDNEQSAAKPIQTDGTLSNHNTCPADDTDWLSFTAAANTSYIIETTQNGPEADTIIALYNESGTQIARNDDHTPGVKSRLSHQISAAGTYYIKVQLYNQALFGSGTEYSVSVKPGEAATPTPTPNRPPPPPPTPTPGNQTGKETLILVNRNRIASLYDDTKATSLMTALDTLAADPSVKGDIIRLDQNTEVSAAYADWNPDSSTQDVNKANKVADAIRRVIMTYVGERQGIKYVVLVGDDRALPMRRVPDNTPRQSEKRYKRVDDDHPTGAALIANYFLTDDYYVDKSPTPHKGREIYVPDYAIGRLIEDPDHMIQMINHFVDGENHTTAVDNLLITGYDFVRDAAQKECNAWKESLTGDKVECLIGNSWSRDDFVSRHLRTDPSPYKFQSINGHGLHNGEGIALGGWLSTDDNSTVDLDLSGGLIYTLACHAGLNVPPENNSNGSPFDLPELYASRGVNYVANTGYGWGCLSSACLSEKVIQLFSQELQKGSNAGTMAQALAEAKRQYFLQDSSISGYDEKVVQQLIFYGLPQYRLSVDSPGSLDTPFDGVDFNFEFSLGSDDYFTRTGTLDFERVFDPESDLDTLGEENPEGYGTFFSLDGFTSGEADEPVQPLHFGDVTNATSVARSVVLKSAEFSTIDNFDPVVGVVYNEWYTNTEEAVLDATGGWYPPVPNTVQSLDDQSSLVTQVGQYNAETKELRQYKKLEVEVIYSLSADQLPPEVVYVDSLYYTKTQQIEVKVGATDSSGIKEVRVAYTEEQGSTSIKTVNLTFDINSQKWTGTFKGSQDTRYYVQVIDQAGNLITETNKDRRYKPFLARTTGEDTGNSLIFLPMGFR
ncbi:MAG: pre-peptidase C-terminal domain-containing protein [Chloroflexota bacterium]